MAPRIGNLRDSIFLRWHNESDKAAGLGCVAASSTVYNQPVAAACRSSQAAKMLAAACRRLSVLATALGRSAPHSPATFAGTARLANPPSEQLCTFKAPTYRTGTAMYHTEHRGAANSLEYRLFIRTLDSQLYSHLLVFKPTNNCHQVTFTCPPATLMKCA